MCSSSILSDIFLCWFFLGMALCVFSRALTLSDTYRPDLVCAAPCVCMIEKFLVRVWELHLQ